MLETNKIYNGNCLDVLKTFEDNCIDSCVTDPPYGISFMNKHWDYQIPSVQIWEQVLRVLKPGGHLLCACGTRTQHRMVCNIEDAGFEIRDVISWIYGSGFPKSLDISKAIDKAAGVEREVTGVKPGHEGFANRGNMSSVQSLKGTLGGKGGFSRPWMDDPEAVERYHSATAPATDAAKQWEGWGTALKPATEFWTLARKPISENTIAENVLKHGTGGLNIEGSRIGNDIVGWGGHGSNGFSGGLENNEDARPIQGRFPANVIFDEFTGKILDEQSGVTGGGEMIVKQRERNKGWCNSSSGDGVDAIDNYGDTGGASRFFYCPKADNFERNKGLKGFEKIQVKHIATTGFTNHVEDNPNYPRANIHPTVKPIDLMRYLVKLITPKHGICVDPFCGSGTTLIGCKMELINFIGIDLNEEYCKIAEARVAAWNPEKYIEQTLF